MGKIITELVKQDHLKSDNISDLQYIQCSVSIIELFEIAYENGDMQSVHDAMSHMIADKLIDPQFLVAALMALVGLDSVSEDSRGQLKSEAIARYSNRYAGDDARILSLSNWVNRF